MKKVGVIGGAGYAAGELISLIARHPQVELSFVTSNSQVGKSVAEFHSDFGLNPQLNFVATHTTDVDVLFLCGGHGFSIEFLTENTIPETCVVIDLSMDYRVDPSFSYGLPELKGYKISNRIANPGCFATAIQLALLPMIDQIQGDIHVQATTASSGAGQALAATGHFSWRANNLSTYKVFEHQHEIEMTHNFKAQGGTYSDLFFVPMRGAFTRGIFATAYFDSNLSVEEATAIYSNYYANAVFTKVVKKPIDLKQVVQTNLCLVHVERLKNKLIVTSAIDNLLKGAAGQAIQNMNNVFGWEEQMGLQLKPSHF